MEVQDNVTSGNNQPEASGKVENEQGNQVSYDSYRKLLGEKKAVQEKLRELEDFKSAMELEKKERLGQHEEVINSLREENKRLKNENTLTKQNFAYSKFEDQVKSFAVKEGCVNPDKLLRLMTKEQIKAVEITDNFEANKDDLKRLMTTLKEEHADIGLFKATSANFTPVTGTSKPEKKSLAEMSKDEILNQLLHSS